MPIAVGSELQLSVTYNSGSVETTCKLQIDFEMGDINANRLFHVEFRIKIAGIVELAQSLKKDSKWVNCIDPIDIDNLVEGDNSIRIVVGTAEFKVYINDKRYSSCVSTKRLEEFTAIRLYPETSECLSPIRDTIQLQNLHKANKGNVINSLIALPGIASRNSAFPHFA